MLTCSWHVCQFSSLLINFTLNEIDGFKHKSQFYYKRGLSDTARWTIVCIFSSFFLFTAKLYQHLSVLHIGCIQCYFEMRNHYHVSLLYSLKAPTKIQIQMPMRENLFSKKRAKSSTRNSAPTK